MRAGDVRLGTLRDRITITRPTRTEDPRTGEITNTWEVVAANVPAAIASAQTERETANKQTAITRATITIRYLPDLAGDTDARLIVDGITYEITAAVDPDRRRRWLILTATATQ